MYLIGIDHLVYEKKGGGTFTLAEAWLELRGVAGCRIIRASDGETVARRGWAGWQIGSLTIRQAANARRARVTREALLRDLRAIAASPAFAAALAEDREAASCS